MESKTKQTTFLLEILSEELPHQEVENGEKKLKELIENLFTKQKIGFAEVKAYSTPKRLAVQVVGVPLILPAQKIVKNGPPLSKCYDNHIPTKMLEGFARSNQQTAPQESDLKQLDLNNTSKNGLYRQNNPQGEFVVYFESAEEISTTKILKIELPKTLEKLTFAKMMHWGNLQGPYLRPIKSIIALLDDDIIPFSFKGINSSNLTIGFTHIPKEKIVTIFHASNYLAPLEEAGVFADREKRLNQIFSQLDGIEKENPDFEIIDKNKVSHTVNQLVEQPHLLVVDFDPKLLLVPEEVTISEMVEHQKYFPIRSKATKQLLPKFIITVNGFFEDTSNIVNGNLKVLTSRLNDGIFLFETDRKLGLKGLSKKLENILFEKTLGTYQDKIIRMAKIAKSLAPKLSQYFELNINLKSDSAHPESLIDEVAPLLKADLSSGMVIEFPHLQGVIGSYYANDLTHPKKTEIAKAIIEHYQPLSPNGDLPSTPLGTLFSIAEKLDNLMGLFSIGHNPTGSQDPYALRRQMQGLIRIFLKNNLSVDFSQFISEQIKSYQVFTTSSTEEILENIFSFVRQRLITTLKEMNYPVTEVKAVISGPLNFHRQCTALSALEEFKKDQSFNDLLILLKRISKMLEKNPLNNPELVREINSDYFENKTEEILFQQYNNINDQIAKMTNQSTQLKIEDFLEVFKLFSAYQKPLADFFEHTFILVDDEKIRNNRLKLLAKIKEKITDWFDFDQIN